MILDDPHLTGLLGVLVGLFLGTQVFGRSRADTAATKQQTKNLTDDVYAINKVVDRLDRDSARHHQVESLTDEVLRLQAHLGVQDPVREQKKGKKK